MDPAPRHQCLIYEGAPSRHLPAVAAVIREKLSQNQRCLYLNSDPMVAGMRSYLAAAGVDVADVTAKTSLVLSSDLLHLDSECHFDMNRMLETLESALEQALKDGYEGLWATGDMTWELGPDKDFSKLLEYEWRLEEFLRENPRMGGICQYHVETVSRKAVRQSVLTHPSIFINETLSMLNPIYRYPDSFTAAQTPGPELDSFVNRVLKHEGAI